MLLGRAIKSGRPAAGGAHARAKVVQGSSNPPHLDEPLAASGGEQLGKERCSVRDLRDEFAIQLHHHRMQAGQAALAAGRRCSQTTPTAARCCWCCWCCRCGEHRMHSLAQALIHCSQLCKHVAAGNRSEEALRPAAAPRSSTSTSSSLFAEAASEVAASRSRSSSHGVDRAGL